MDIISLLLKNKRVVYFLIFIILFPAISNLLVFSWGTTITNGTLESWMSFFATYYGAIIGGIIAGALTLIGVKMTISSAMDGVNKTIEQQQTLRDQEIKIQTEKERLIKFYGPMDTLINQYNFKRPSHEFGDLDFDDQIRFMTIMSDNLIYSDSEIYILAIEMRWAYKEKDYNALNERYKMVSDLITEELHSIRELLHLPTIEI